MRLPRASRDGLCFYSAMVRLLAVPESGLNGAVKARVVWAVETPALALALALRVNSVW